MREIHPSTISSVSISVFCSIFLRSISTERFTDLDELFLVKFTALVYFSGPWEHFLALWQYFKIILFQITNKTNLT